MVEIGQYCKLCGSKLFASDSIKAGYCGSCATIDDTARKAWEEKGLAKFCSICGLMLYSSESIETGICAVCRNLSKP